MIESLDYPKKIYEKVLNNEMTKNEASLQLIELIEKADNSRIILNSLEILDKLKTTSEAFFLTLKKLCYYVMDPNVRIVSINLILKYCIKEGLEFLRVLIQNENSLKILTSIFKCLRLFNNESSIMLKEDLVKKFSTFFNIIPNEAPFFIELFELYLKNTNDEIKSKNHIPKAKNKSVETLTIFGLKTIPESIYLLSELKSLYISGYYYNRMTTLPKTIEKLINLEKLDLSCNSFTEIPGSICKLKNLKQLNLSKNLQLERIPNCLINLAKQNFSEKFCKQGIVLEEAAVLGLLEMLMGDNPFVDFGKDFRINDNEWYFIEDPFFEVNNSGHVTTLHLHLFEDYKTVVFPEEICSLKYLEKLSLDNDFIKKVPDSIRELTSLKRLYLANNQIKSLPESIGELKHLELLDLSNNPIESIPSSIKNLNSLKYLNLSSINLKVIPEEIFTLTNLETLTLYGNQIVEIPNSISKLHNLILLDLNANRIKKIPESLGTLSKLEILYLIGNKIEKIPKSLENLKSLKQFNLRDNNLKEIPEFIKKIKVFRC